MPSNIIQIVFSDHKINADQYLNDISYKLKSKVELVSSNVRFKSKLLKHTK